MITGGRCDVVVYRYRAEDALYSVVTCTACDDWRYNAMPSLYFRFRAGRFIGSAMYTGCYDTIGGRQVVRHSKPISSGKVLPLLHVHGLLRLAAHANA